MTITKRSGAGIGADAGPDAPAPLAAGLYLVATPIGNAGDMTLRGLDILRRADAIAAEDTRTARRLMDIHGVPLGDRPLIAYHDHNGAARRPAILRRIAAGESVALVSEAGTPMIADPGYKLVREAAGAGLPVTAAPGASAALTALCVAGLPTDRFLFAGFLPVKSGARRAALRDLAPIPATLVIYEAPRRAAVSLAAMAEILGPERPAALCRELTKRFEEVRRGALGDLAAALGGETPPKGELVIVIGPPPPRDATQVGDDLEAALRNALKTASLKDAVRDAAQRTGVARKIVYARALEIAADDEGDAPDW